VNLPAMWPILLAVLGIALAALWLVYSDLKRP
jgi:hypothetical protein